MLFGYIKKGAHFLQSLGLTPVQTPVTFSSSPLVHVFPEPGKLARATGSLPCPFMKWHTPFTFGPYFLLLFTHLSEH